MSNEDAAAFLTKLQSSLPANSLVYLDPPYYDKGQHLYHNYYHHSDHEEIAELVHADEVEMPESLSVSM